MINFTFDALLVACDHAVDWQYQAVEVLSSVLLIQRQLNQFLQLLIPFLPQVRLILSLLPQIFSVVSVVLSSSGLVRLRAINSAMPFRLLLLHANLLD